MQPDLPWNVAGIPPEAREAARAAARREGLSVGEWLTRRILRSLTENGEQGGWQRGHEPDYRMAPDEPAGRAPEERAARPGDNEAVAAYLRIEEQLRNLGKRLEAQEKTHTDSSRAVSQAAAEINSAAREQAQAFEQLGSHVVGLGERINRVERSSQSDNLKEAIKSLHAGLARLAEQITEKSNQSASQISALASRLEAVAGNTNQSASQIAALTSRLEAVAGNTHHSASQIAALASKLEAVSSKIGDVKSDAEHTARQLAQRIAAYDERMRASEVSSLAITDRLDKSIAGLEAARNARSADQAESARQALAISQLRDAFDKLLARISSSEAQTAGAMARVENQIVESRHTDQPVDRRLQGIELALADIAGRLDSAECSATISSRTVEENLRNVSSRLEAADQRHRDAIAELQAQVAEPPAPAPVFAPPPNVTPLAASIVASPLVAPPLVAPPLPSTPAGPAMDLPPFPEPPPASPPPVYAEAESQPEIPPESPPESREEPFTTEGLPIIPGPAETADSYIAAARRSAREASHVDTQAGLRGPLGGFSWGTTPSPLAEPATEKAGVARYVLIGGIVAIIVAAIVAGVLLSRGLVGGAPKFLSLPQTRTQAHRLPAVHHRILSQAFAAALPNSTPVATTVPGSPVIPSSDKPASTPAAPVQVAAVKPAAAPLQTTPPQPVAPLERLTMLAQSGNAKAELLIGLKYLDGEGVSVNEAEAAKWLERAARQNEAIAAYRLGTLYERGHGVPADAAKAIEWYTAAAKLGNRKAMHNLAVAYAEGAGAQKDLPRAAQWFSKAAALGLADSQFNLAVLYERGMGVQQSLVDAYKWYAVAAAQGDSESKARLDVLSTQLSADERAAAQKAAGDFHPLPLDRNANVPPDLSSVG